MNKFKGLLSNIVVYTLIIFGIIFITKHSCKMIDDIIKSHTVNDTTLCQDCEYKLSAYKNCVIQVLDITGSKAMICIRYFDNDNSTDEVAIKQFLINRFAGITLSNISSEEFDNLINELKTMCTLVEISIESI